MSLFQRLQRHAEHHGDIKVAVTGAGRIGRALVQQIDLTNGLRTAVVVNRTADKGVSALLAAGRKPHEIAVTDDTAAASNALRQGHAVVTTVPELLAEIDALDVVVEATGAVEYGARVALAAIEGGKHIVMMNAETDATVGCALHQHAELAGVVYTNSDGDQPGVLKRLVDYVNGIGLSVTAAINCKGFMDRYATPESIRPWSEMQKTSPAMTTAFTDGTKMNIENAVLANATGLRPDRRGMHGIETTLAHALEDCLAVLGRPGVVDYTLGGDFAGGVFVIGTGEDHGERQELMQYLKMGEGPHYLFYRPYHLCHMETPLTIAEAVLDHEPTIAPVGLPVAEVAAIAKRDLVPGDILDGIGGYSVYGEIDSAAGARTLLPMGLAHGVTVTRAVSRDEPVPLDAVDLGPETLLHRLRAEQIESVDDRRAAAG